MNVSARGGGPRSSAERDVGPPPVDGVLDTALVPPRVRRGSRPPSLGQFGHGVCGSPARSRWPARRDLGLQRGTEGIPARKSADPHGRSAVNLRRESTGDVARREPRPPLRREALLSSFCAGEREPRPDADVVVVVAARRQLVGHADVGVRVRPRTTARRLVRVVLGSRMCSPKSDGSRRHVDPRRRVPCPDCGQKEPSRRRGRRAGTCRCGLSPRRARLARRRRRARSAAGAAHASGGRVPVRRTSVGRLGRWAAGGRSRAACRSPGAWRSGCRACRASRSPTRTPRTRARSRTRAPRLHPRPGARARVPNSRGRCRRSERAPLAERVNAPPRRSLAMPQLTACAKVVRRQNAEPLPTARRRSPTSSRASATS